jgi:arabinogalactan oligomer/maltooligosaccharide transport system substrate-binding protein
MDRRSALKSIGVTGIIGGLAGCASVQEDGETTDGSDDSSNDGDESDRTETTEMGPAGTAKAWYSLQDTELQNRESALEEFNSNSRHTLEGADVSDLRKKTTSAIPAGEGPQVFDWGHDWVGDYHERGFLTDRSDQLGVELDAFTEVAADVVQFDGNVLGLPYGAETVGLIYNEEMVDEPPETVDEMTAIMDEHHDPENNTYGLSYPFDPYFASAWAQAFGGYYFDAETDPQLGLTQSETIEGVQFALDTLRPYMPRDPTYEAQAAPFAEGNAALAINGPWYLATLNEKGVDFGVVDFPSIDGGNPRPLTGIQVWYFAKAMGEDDAAATAAQDFVEWYVTNEDLLVEAAEQQGSIPVLQELKDSDQLPDQMQGFAEAVGQGVPMPTDPKMGDVWDPLTDALTNAFNDDATVEEAMQTAEESIRENWE